MFSGYTLFLNLDSYFLLSINIGTWFWTVLVFTFHHIMFLTDKYKSEEPLPSYSVVGSSSAFGISNQRVSPLLQLQISISTWNLDAAGCCLLYHYVTFSNNYEIQRHFISLFEMPASDLDLICWLLIVHPAYILLYLNFKTGSFTSLYDLITETYWLHDVGLMVAWHCCSYQMGHIRSSLLILGRSQC